MKSKSYQSLSFLSGDIASRKVPVRECAACLLVKKTHCFSLVRHSHSKETAFEIFSSLISRKSSWFYINMFQPTRTPQKWHPKKQLIIVPQRHHQTYINTFPEHVLATQNFSWQKNHILSWIRLPIKSSFIRKYKKHICMCIAIHKHTNISPKSTIVCIVW